jgi:PAS domain S-box-containing protein
MSASDTGRPADDLEKVVLDQLSVPVISCKIDGSVIYFNAAAARCLATCSQDLLGSRIDSVLPGLASDAWNELLGLLGTEGKRRFESCLQLPDGSRRSALVTAQLTRSQRTECCTLLLEGVLDPGDRIKAELFAQRALELAPLAVYWIRRDGALLYANQAACDMLGYTREELSSLTMPQLNVEMSPDRWTQTWQALAQQRRRTFLSAHRARDGRIIPVEISARMFELDGEEFSCAFGRDVTEQRTAIETHRREHVFLESLVETAPVMIVVFDEAGGIVRFNRCAERVTGYALDEVRGARWLDILTFEADRAEVEKMVHQSLSGAKSGSVQRLRTKSGEAREITWHRQLLDSTDTHSVGLLAVGLDITEQRELEQRLRQAEKMEAIGRLAGGIAHDFNNQLTGIMGWAEILGLETPNHPTIAECVERIMLASKRASDLTSQLLAYSRKGKFVIKPVDLHVVVREAAAILARSIDKRITVVLDLQAPDPYTVGDATQLGNAVLNLALNARDAMPEGGKLTISSHVVYMDASQCQKCLHEVTPGEFIELAVSDSGNGISDEIRLRMFEPFFTTKEEGHGTGMGLAAVYGTVRNHHGTITVTSAIGRGTRICIHLPRGQAENRDSVQAMRPVPTTFGPLKLLVVDDEESVRELTKRLLSYLGCDVVTVENGFLAVEHYGRASSSVDAVILDMAMPILDGKSTYYALRRINPEVKVILMSGYSLDGAAQSLIDEGALGFIRKPFTLETLAEAISGVAVSRTSVAPVRSARPEDAC